MREIGQLKEVLKHNITHLISCWIVKRNDGLILRFSDSIENIIFENEIYISHAGFKLNEINENNLLNFNHSKIEGVIENDLITNEDLLLGKYDQAIVENFLIDYKNLDLGRIFIKRGYIGNIKISGHNKFIAEIKDPLELADQHLNCRYSINCRANFGDNKCKIDLTKYYYHGSITKIIDQKTFLDENCSKDSDYFNYGMIIFTKQNIKTNIKFYINNLFELVMPVKFDLRKGTNFVAIAGCDKTLKMCSNRFNNIANFRGEPYIPSYEKIYKLPNL